MWNASSIKPVDDDAIVAAAACKFGVVSVEDHNVLGGLGGAVAEVLTTKKPARLLRLGINDVFGESGEPAELYAHHGIDAAGIARSVKAFCA